MIQLKFKHPHLELEWPCVFAPLRMAIMCLLDYVWCELEGDHPRELVLTCLHRTPDENKKVGGNPRSLHMDNPTRAADISVYDRTRKKSFSDQQLVQMQEFWDNTYPKSFKFLIESNHIHVQVARTFKA